MIGRRADHFFMISNSSEQEKWNNNHLEEM